MENWSTPGLPGPDARAIGGNPGCGELPSTSPHHEITAAEPRTRSWTGGLKVAVYAWNLYISISILYVCLVLEI